MSLVVTHKLATAVDTTVAARASYSTKAITIGAPLDNNGMRNDRGASS